MTLATNLRPRVAGPRIAPGVPRRQAFKAGRRASLCTASAEAGRLLMEGKQKYEAGDRMGALLTWERLVAAEPTTEQLRAALFNSTCVHAAFGDVELAQITLREAVLSGLDFKAATETPTAVDPALVRLVASQQVLIRLRKFNEAVLKKAGAAAAPPPFSSGGPSGRGARPSGGRSGGKRGASLLQDDLSELLETDMQGIDTSVFGIVKRVAVVLVVLSLLGIGLYFFGLRYLEV